MARFTRIQRLLGEERFQLLSQSRITVVGVGAVGGYAVEGLARAGVGQLHLVDFDTVEPSNINRQIHALDSTVGQLKVEVATNRVLDINPACHVTSTPLFVAKENIPQLLAAETDLIIDAIDSLDSKVALLHQAWRQRLTILSAMGAALRQDPCLVRLADLLQTQKCPMARQVRKRLRRLGVGEGIRCVYSMEEVDFSAQQDIAAEDNGQTGKPRPLGSLPTVTGIFGLTLANEAIRIITTG